MKNNKKLSDDELEKTAGGNEPEEFDWHSKGYTTPIKDQNKDDDSWSFSAIGNTVGQYFKIIKEGLEHIGKPNKDDWRK